MAVFLVIGGLLSGAWLFPKTGLIEERGVLGGPSPAPSLIDTAEGAEIAAEVSDISPIAPILSSDSSDPTENPTAPVANVLYAPATVKDMGVPVGPAFDRLGMVTYTVQRGDNLSSIASYFGVSIDTVINANPGIRANALGVGAALKILPTSGVVYQTKAGDTLASISSHFNISQDTILRFNKSATFSSLDPGTSIIIPGGTRASLVANQKSTLPNFNKDFVLPAQGYNWGTLHHYNAIDVANSCGTPVVASAEGLVVPDESIPNVLGGWNGGYGNFVLIEHPFGNDIRTRYAHLEKIVVQIGDYVKQGQEIGLMGESGEATGCHVHFEVIGAQNPFAK